MPQAVFNSELVLHSKVYSVACKISVYCIDNCKNISLFIFEQKVKKWKYRGIVFSTMNILYEYTVVYSFTVLSRQIGVN